MSRRIFGLLLICLAFACLPPQARSADDEEPSFLDKKLSHWLGLLETGKDAKTRRQGVIAIEQIGPASKKSLPALLKAMQDKETVVRKDLHPSEERSAISCAHRPPTPTRCSGSESGPC